MADNIEIAVTGDYVDWTIWEAIRELLQNAKDADDLGYDMHIVYDEETKTLTLKNEGVELGRDKLVLGATTKRDNPLQRGTFGEGFKLAFSALLEMGRAVVVRTGNERWEPKLKPSKNFGGQEILTIQSEWRSTPSDFTVTIEPIEPHEWDLIDRRTLFLNSEGVEKIRCPDGHLITSPEHAGMIYHQGLFIRDYDEDMKFGYSFNTIEMDRDRRMVDDGELKRKMRNIICDAVTIEDGLNPEVIYNFLQESRDLWEPRAICSDYWVVADMIGDRILECWENEYGEGTIPVRNRDEVKKAEKFGLKAAVCTYKLRSLLEPIVGSLDTHINEEDLEVEILSPAGLDEEMSEILTSLRNIRDEVFRKCDLIDDVTHSEICVADFELDKRKVIWQEGAERVILSKAIASQKAEATYWFARELRSLVVIPEDWWMPQHAPSAEILYGLIDI